MTLSKRRPPIRLILLAMLLIAMATPLVGLFFLRVIENQFVRRTEAELIGQSAALSAVIAERIQLYRLDDAWFGRAPQPVRPAPRRIPMPPRLDLASVRSRRAPPRPPCAAASRLHAPRRVAGRCFARRVGDLGRRTQGRS